MFITKSELVGFLDSTDKISDNDTISLITVGDKAIHIQGQTVENSHQQTFELIVPLAEAKGKGTTIDYGEDNKIIII